MGAHLRAVGKKEVTLGLRVLPGAPLIRLVKWATTAEEHPMALFPMTRAGLHATFHPSEAHVTSGTPAFRFFERFILNPDEQELRAFIERFTWKGSGDEPLWRLDFPNNGWEGCVIEEVQGDKVTLIIDTFAIANAVSRMNVTRLSAKEIYAGLSPNGRIMVMDVRREELVMLSRDPEYALAFPSNGMDAILQDAPIFRGLAGPIHRGLAAVEKAGLMRAMPPLADLEQAYAPFGKRLEATWAGVIAGLDKK